MQPITYVYFLLDSLARGRALETVVVVGGETLPSPARSLDDSKCTVVDLYTRNIHWKKLLDLEKDSKPKHGFSLALATPPTSSPTDREGLGARPQALAWHFAIPARFPRTGSLISFENPYTALAISTLLGAHTIDTCGDSTVKLVICIV